MSCWQWSRLCELYLLSSGAVLEDNSVLLTAGQDWRTSPGWRWERFNKKCLVGNGTGLENNVLLCRGPEQDNVEAVLLRLVSLHMIILEEDKVGSGVSEA